jgi:SET domain-containing protein
MELSAGLYVDAKTKGGWSRLINHSCEPNCELQRWNVAGLLRIGIFAIRDIAQHESLSYDYQVSV